MLKGEVTWPSSGQVELSFALRLPDSQTLWCESKDTTRQLRIPWQHPSWMMFSACIPNPLPLGSVIPCPSIHHLWALVCPVTARGWCPQPCPLHRILWELPELQGLRKHLENSLCRARRERQSQLMFRVVLSPRFLLLIQEGVKGCSTGIFSSSLSNFLKHQADMQKTAFSDANFSLNHGSFKTTRWSIENAWQFLEESFILWVRISRVSICVCCVFF